MTVHLVTGDGRGRDDAVAGLVNEMVGTDDRSLAVEELTLPDKEATSEDRRQAAAAAANAASSPPFGTRARIVVVRDVGVLSADEAVPLVAYLDDPLPTTELVLVGGGGTPPTSLTKAVTAAGGEKVSVRAGRAADHLEQQSTAVGVALTRAARDRISAHLGDDAERVPELMQILRAVSGEDAPLDVDDVEPYLGEAGARPAWELNNALDAGDVPGAVERVRGLLVSAGARTGGPMHPLQVMAMLHNHYRRLLALDDPAITNEEQAAEVLRELTGRKVKAYPAKLALSQARALGSDRLRRAVDLLATADVDLRGGTGLDGELVMELLVARLAGLSRGSGRRGSGRAGRVRQG